MLIWCDKWLSKANIKLHENYINESLNLIRQVWNELSPNIPFEYEFLETIYNKEYQKEEKTAKIFMYFSFLAMFIATLGLFGLSAFVTEQKTKEIAIRKVLGASPNELINMLIKEFINLILIANLFALPLAYFFILDWLRDFVYQTDIVFWVFLIPSLFSFIIAFFTIIFHALKVTRQNPTTILTNL